MGRLDHDVAAAPVDVAPPDQRLEDGTSADRSEEQASAERLERLGAATGLAAIISVGVAVVAFEVFGGAGQLRSPVWLWWTVYALYLGAFLLDAWVVASPRAGRWLLALQLVSGCIVFALYPLGWSGVVLVVTAASAAFRLAPRPVAAIVIGQSALIAITLTVVGGWHPAEIGMATVVYGSFQAFAVLVTLGQRREARAREELAAALRELAVAHRRLERTNTELAGTNAELRATTALLASTTRSAERLRIARDLHDVVGHQLTALALELEVASHRTDGAGAVNIGRARDIAKDLLGDVRATVGELRDAPKGLQLALLEHVRDVPGLHVDLQVDEQAAVDEDRALTILRSVQELITNTLRHAGARHLWIRITADTTGVRLHARDDGRGTASLIPGNGLRGLRERFETHGGAISFDAGGDGAGFSVDAHLPAAR